MKCIYCNAETDLSVSDIIPAALTGAKLKKRFVCRTHNSFADLLDFEHEDRIIPVYILEQIYSHKDEYLPSEDFYRNMQRILRTDNRFVFTKDTAKEILERYLVMDREGTFATLLCKAIEPADT